MGKVTEDKHKRRGSGEGGLHTGHASELAQAVLVITSLANSEAR